MRKGKIGGENIDIYTLFRVKGVNLDSFLQNIAKNMEIRDVKKSKDCKSVYVGIKKGDTEKFFAITKEMCYNNIVKIKEYGKGYFFNKLLKNCGILIGGLIFCLIFFFSDNYVFGFSYTGTGRVCYKEVEEYLLSSGIKPFTDISKVDLATLSDGILKSNPRLTFAEVKKIGHTLRIELALSENGKPNDLGLADKLVSDVDGEILELKVYRGTAVKNVGDKVKKGETVVDGYSVIKDVKVETSVLCFAVLKAEYTFDCVSSDKNFSLGAISLAKESLGEKDIIDEKVEIINQEENYKYIVKLYYKRVLYS